MPKVRKTVTVREEQQEWLEDNNINASKLFREAIDEHRDVSGIEKFKK